MNLKFTVLSILLICSGSASTLADEYQRGFSTSRTCTRNEYREEYVPGTRMDPGYVKKWEETVEVPCPGVNSTTIQSAPNNSAPIQEEYDNNDCTDGKIAGAILGGGAAAAMSRGDGRWWAIPLGVVTGSAIGCDLDGG